MVLTNIFLVLIYLFVLLYQMGWKKLSLREVGNVAFVHFDLQVNKPVKLNSTNQAR